MKSQKKLTIGIAGLGLIGGSLAKSTRENTAHTVLGLDTDQTVVLKARLLDAVHRELTVDNLKQCDIILIALHPVAAEQFLADNAANFSASSVVIDCCGVKREICRTGEELAQKHGFTFIGGHPMAGKERSGFEHSAKGLFNRASMILAPRHDIDLAKIEQTKQFFLDIGFGSVKLSTPAEHDQVVAYTSHLAHILSNAYVKSDAALHHRGFSAGSFRDMTRVATLHPGMWTELFMANKDNLIVEMENLIANLTEYLDALKKTDNEKIFHLLDDGVKRKAEIDKLS